MVGWGVGVEVGIRVGTRVGSGVGLSVGLVVGRSVGRSEGRSVGRCVGRMVGSEVGAWLGDTVGTAVGSAVGWGEGAVGAEVGAGMSPQHRRRAVAVADRQVPAPVPRAPTMVLYCTPVPHGVDDLWGTGSQVFEEDDEVSFTSRAQRGQKRAAHIVNQTTTS